MYIYIYNIKSNNWQSHNRNKIKNSASLYLKHLLKTFQERFPHNSPQCRSTEKSSKRKREEKCSIVNPGD